MPILATSHLPQPTDWNEFEDMCADLFSREWGDANAFRYGRQGQRQNGVDIYGAVKTAAVQCKGRRHWPLRELKTSDIDAAVTEAKAFQHPISEFTIATTAPVGTEQQDHALAITRDHRAKGLFIVNLVGWDDFIRRFTQHGNLVEKYYSSFVSFPTIQAGIDSVREAVEKVPDLIIQRAALTATQSAASAPVVPDLQTIASITEPIERDFAHRYNIAMRRSFFPENNNSTSYQVLAREILDGPHTNLSTNLRRQILLRAARSSALRGELDEARRFLTVGSSLPGDESDAPARARLAEAQEQLDEAFKILRDETDADSQSTLFIIIARHRGDAAALAFLQEKGLSAPNLTPNGVFTLSNMHLKKGDIQAVKPILEQLSEDTFIETPYFYFVRGAVRFASLVPQPDQAAVLRGFPPDVRLARITAAKTVASSELDGAINDFNRVVSLAQELGLREAKRIAESYITWCELLHPVRHDDALRRLRRDMAEPKSALGKVQLAFAFDPDFDPAPIEKYLEKRESLGGLDRDELSAALVLRLHGNNARSLADFISGHRAQLEATFGQLGIVTIEIQALAAANDGAAAKLLFEQHRNAFDSQLATLLQAEIAKADGADPVAEAKRAYEATKSIEALRALITQLVKHKDHAALGHYFEILYDQTKDSQDAEHAARAFANAGDDDNLLRLLREHPFIEKGDPSLARYHAWGLFQRGHTKDAAQIAKDLRNLQSPDLDLEIAIAIETGDWEALAQPLNDYLSDAANRGGPALIRAAYLSQASEQGPLIGLMNAAVQHGGDDPDVLVGAYSLVIERGLEDKRPEAAQWFRRALDVSGEDGPVKAFELKEVLAQQLQWNEYSQKITDAVTKGDLPLTLAAPVLRTTFVDALLGNLIRNSTLSDARRKAALPLFSGQRPPSAFGDVSRILLDTSALMVTGWLGLLQKVIDTYSGIIVPAGALHELFEGCGRIRRFQRSRIENARQIQEAIARGRLHVLPLSASRPDPLEAEIGTELAALIRAAQTSNGIVVRPPPVRRFDGTAEVEVDVSNYADRLTDMHSVLAAMVGAIDQITEEVARNYFTTQDKGWPSPAPVNPKTPIFLDGLALTYLQIVGLFDAFLTTFPNVYVTQEVKDESATLIDFEGHTKAVLATIDDIRTIIRAAHASGKVLFGPYRKHPKEEEWGRTPPSILNLLADLMGADIALVDDRALNKDTFVTDTKGQRAGLAFTLDLIEDLAARGALSPVERRALRHRLRLAGAVLLPLDAEEVVTAALRSTQIESVEFRAIRENIDLTRIRNVPRFPLEIRWFASISMAIQHALIQLWNPESAREKAALAADAVFDLRTKPEEWVSLWEGGPPPEWCDAVNRVMTIGLALPMEITTEDAGRAYNDWLETRVLIPLRTKSPEKYRAVIEGIRAVILDVQEEPNDQ
jgi:hypothetical protein